MINVGFASHPRRPIVNVYPNPFNEFIMIDMNLYEVENVSINVYSLTGKLVLSDQVNGKRSFTKLIDLRQYSSGFFVVQVVTKNNIITKKVVKR